ncbi:unnamed protein product [Linum tenue]|uniref:Uncharacterized protein n=1 Tax=Linum tenue TaxID=586396 RepID=A0AAV0IJN4_9ROSI|nr:unnamed protein product [Linum tenue]
MSNNLWVLWDDQQFIRTFKGSRTIHVLEYKGEADPNAFEMVHAARSTAWKERAKVSADDASCYRKLKVLGVRIHGEQLGELADDLTITGSNGQTFHLMVNRRGLCFLEIDNEMGRVKRLRINDHFGWSKYGVRPETSTAWSVSDMDNGAVLVGPPTPTTSSSSSCWKKVQEEKDKLMKSLLLHDHDEHKD